ncbi:MAG: hypothetical protein ACK559_41720, partial [bacterium]
GLAVPDRDGSAAVPCQVLGRLPPGLHGRASLPRVEHLHAEHEAGVARDDHGGTGGQRRRQDLGHPSVPYGSRRRNLGAVRLRSRSRHR